MTKGPCCTTGWSSGSPATRTKLTSSLAASSQTPVVPSSFESTAVWYCSTGAESEPLDAADEDEDAPTRVWPSRV